jgi:hypothetical protein
MPEASAIRSCYPPVTRATIDRYLGSLAQSFGVAVIRAENWSRDEWLADSYHHTPAGAAQFSSRLFREAILPLLSSAGSSRQWGAFEVQPN